MSVSLISTALSFNGASSTSPQYSSPTSVGNETTLAFIISATVTTAPLAMTLQFNTDPANVTVNGWQDYAVSSARLFSCATSALIGQTSASIDSSETRTGVITSTTTLATYVIQFTPFPANWRIAFQIGTATVASVSAVLRA